MNDLGSPVNSRGPRPYLGLDFFHAEDAPLFTERETEIEDCATKLLELDVKIFVLQGSTGAGKSSFLRAGLIPRLRRWEVGAPQFICDGDCVVRCTSNPLRKIADSLNEAIAARRFTSGPQQIDIIETDVAILSDGTQFVESILATLQRICKTLPGHLILIVDQAEEVLTQASDRIGMSKAARDFFYFLEEIYLRNLDVRMIVGIRTEYYGRFREELRIEDNRLAARPDEGGIDTYLLRSIRNREALKRIILAPTTFGDGRAFNFTFDIDAVDKIVTELLNFLPYGSVTPLLQVICSRLYEGLPEQLEPRRITLKNFEALGNIRGIAINYLDRGVGRALGHDASRREKGGWLQLLHSLTSTQGGGIVVSNTESLSTLQRKAKRLGIRSDIEPVLQRMAHGSVPLLLGLPVESPTEFSLKHDVLAVILQIWVVARAAEQAGRRRTLRIYGTAAAFCFLVFAGFALYHNQKLKYDAMQNVVTERLNIARTPANSDFSRSLIFLLSALTSVDSCPLTLQDLDIQDIRDLQVGRDKLRCRPLRDKVLADFRSILLRSPRISEEVLAAGFDPEGNSVVLLPKARSSMSRVALGPDLRRTTLSAARLARPSNSGDGALKPVNVAASTQAGRGSSLLVDSTYFHWDAQGSADRPVELGSNVLKANGNPYAQYALRGTNLEVMIFNLQPNSVYIEMHKLLGIGPGWKGEDVRFGFPRNDILVRPPLSSDSARSPDSYAYLARLADDGDAFCWNLRLPNRLASISLPGIVHGNTTRLGFVGGTNALLVQRDTGGFDYVDLSSPPFKSLLSRCNDAGESLAGVPVSFDANAAPNQAARLPKDSSVSYVHSPIAGVRHDQQLSVAWIADGGVAIARGPFGKTLVNPADGGGPNLLLSGESNGSQLQFSDDGKFLLLQYQPFLYGPVRVRIWDLSEERAQLIRAAQEPALIQIACAIIDDLKKNLPGSGQQDSISIMSALGANAKCQTVDKSKKGARS